VGRILKELGFSLRVNQKSISTSPVCAEVRDEQFRYIGKLRQSFSAAGHPVVSVDTKKKELVGSFKNQGQAWSQAPVPVNDHDFRSQADGIATPYGIYDVGANRGSVYVGISSDTPELATDCLSRWYQEEGRDRYPNSNELLILADSGGSNGYRCRAWKHGLQLKLANRHSLKVTVCHYPPGCSKWNLIEHRLFSEISKNWSGRPLDSYETILNYISTTTTDTGLQVRACLHSTEYIKGIRITDEEMAALALCTHDIQPERNYTIIPNVASSKTSNRSFDRWTWHTREQQQVAVKSGSYF